jgi:TfoX/Sxy family transcriptional regulator of competence genes
MAYNEALANRLRNALAHLTTVEEKKMMGGLTFMVNGKMCVGIVKEDLMVRLDPAVYDAALKKKGCREMTFTGKPMQGYVFVSPEGIIADRDLDAWIKLALDFNMKAKAATKKMKKINSPPMKRV